MPCLSSTRLKPPWEGPYLLWLGGLWLSVGLRRARKPDRHSYGVACSRIDSMGSRFWSQARTLQSLIISKVHLLKEVKVQATACEEVRDWGDLTSTEMIKCHHLGKEEEGYHTWSTSCVVGCMHFFILWETDSLHQNNFSHHLLSWAPSPNPLTYVNSLPPHANSAQDVL